MTVTVGQQVLFHPLRGIIHPSLPHGVTLTATVAHILPDGKLNLGVLDINGVNHSMTNVPLVAKGEQVPERDYYAEEVAEKQSPRSAEDVPLSAASQPAAGS